MKVKRQSRVEPLIGKLLQFVGLHKISTIGKLKANKVMQQSIVACTIKKHL